MTDTIQTRPEADAILDFVRDTYGEAVIEIPAAPDGTTLATTALVLPQGLALHSLKALRDEYRTAPVRKRGTAVVTDLDSLIQLARYHRSPEAALFVRDDRKSPALTIVLDYHGTEPADPRFGTHRIHYAPDLSDEWQAWAKVRGAALAQADFAAFLEDRALDLAPVPEWLMPGTDAAPATPADQRLRDAVRRLGGRVAGPERIIELSRGLDLTEDTRVARRVNLDTGEQVLVYEAEHKDESGQRLTVPNLFLIAIPVFRGGTPWLLAVRLRYRLAGGDVKWSVEIARLDEAFDQALDELARRAQAETAIPLYRGAPEMKGLGPVETA